MTAAAPTPAPTAPAPVVHPPLPVPQALAYMGAAVMLALSQGLGQGFVSANIPQIAGDLGITTTQASWLMAAYMIPRASLPLLLIKIRTQYGLRRFAEVGIIAYVAVALASVWMQDFRSAVVLQALSGAAAAPLSTLAFMYMLEPLSQQWKMRLGLPAAMAVMMSGPTLARVVSPALIGDGGLGGIHLTALGMAMVSLMLVFRLPLRPVPHMKVIQSLDFLSFLLIGFGFAGLTIGFVLGPIHNWTDAPWVGALLAASVASLAVAVAVELNREAPLLDIRWLVSPAMLHLTATLFLFRLILSEQSAGAPRMFLTLGVPPSQMTGLFAIIVGASLLGGLACVAWMRPNRVAVLHLIALLLIAGGALMDAQATIDTRPEQMIVSQALIGFAGMLFLPPAMMAGLVSALARGPQYLLSFVIVFISTQSLGGVLGSGLFTTFINNRQAAHYAVLTEQIAVGDAPTMQAIAARAAGLAAQVPDAASRSAQAAAQIAQEATAQASVMAYNDAYLLTALIALGAALALVLHMLRDRLALRMSPQAEPDVTP
ncbi:MFS transporter [Paracoccus aerius]|uniref:MFS transporter n=1 Tax=Paracoccus aerius TaxID=1915382 RepID=A0ABS1S960_9RHOB|nr:MFS transporter [Paracoccus aerius]MBL3675273.1 MFS transporter [Paracoccus aerius]GHG20775.1 MFS transporter [Paracoccus aerius]